MAKKIFISHSSKDNLVAEELANQIRETFGEDQLWIDMFDLDGGAKLATAIPNAIQEASWFILLASKSSVASQWVLYEATLATLLEIERENYNILTIKLDDCQFPKDLNIQLRTRKYLDASNERQKVFREVVEILGKDSSIPKTARLQEPFVGRGPEQDTIEIAVTRHKIVYLLGIPGIGKSSLVKKLAISRFQRSLITIDLRVSHDTELFTRQVIAAIGQAQPDTDDEETLVETTIWLLKQFIEDRGMLLLNNVQNSTTVEGEFQSYLKNFLEKYAQQDISFPIFITSTRVVNIAPKDIMYTVPIRIEKLTTNFMLLAVQQWYRFMNPGIQPYSDEEIRDLVEKLGGYPLAAKLIAGELTFESPKNLAQKTSISRFHQEVAEFILSKMTSMLNDIDKNILYTIAVFDTPITIRYLMAVKSISKHGIDKVADAIRKLTRLMLINQDIDSYELHPFIASYFGDEARREDLFNRIAEDLVEISLGDTKNVLKKLDGIPQANRSLDNRIYANFSRELLQVAVPTHRLLLVTGNTKELEVIPYKFKGHIREMVFLAYDKAKDYKTCVNYATQWLNIDPDDTQILLYQARAYQRLEYYEEAEKILDRLERESDSTFTLCAIMDETTSPSKYSKEMKGGEQGQRTCQENANRTRKWSQKSSVVGSRRSINGGWWLKQRSVSMVS